MRHNYVDQERNSPYSSSWGASKAGFGNGILVQATNLMDGTQARARLDLDCALQLSTCLLAAADAEGATWPPAERLLAAASWRVTAAAGTITLTVVEEPIPCRGHEASIAMGLEDARDMASAILDAARP